MSTPTEKYKRTRLWITVGAIGGAFVLAVLIAGSIAVFSLLFPTPGTHCFDHVKSIATELEVNKAGEVVNQNIGDRGGFNDCGAPSEFIELKGTSPNSILAASLRSAGFVEGNDELTWTRERDDAQVLLDIEHGNTTLSINAK